MKEGPLDMRMDPTSDLTASEVINRFSEEELGKIFLEYGEEPKGKKVAKAIVERRRKKMFQTTTDLVECIASVLGGSSKKRLHPATLIFQAIRICVNEELSSIMRVLGEAIKRLSPQGRIGVISFHSLEDRIVKNVFRSAAHVPKKSDMPAVLRLLTKKPLVPSFLEMKSNPRSRSAKLRFAEKN